MMMMMISRVAPALALLVATVGTTTLHAVSGRYRLFQLFRSTTRHQDPTDHRRAEPLVFQLVQTGDGAAPRRCDAIDLPFWVPVATDDELGRPKRSLGSQE